MRFFKYAGKAITASAYLAGAAILAMMLITTVDIILRIFGAGITGAYDLVRACGVLAVAFALPYVTAVKGHIAIEYFYHKGSRPVRLILDTTLRLFSLGIFGTLMVQTFRHGLTLLKNGEVFPTLEIPVFWIPLVISLNCLLMMIVFLYHLFHPGKEYIKP